MISIYFPINLFIIDTHEHLGDYLTITIHLHDLSTLFVSHAMTIIVEITQLVSEKHLYGSIDGLELLIPNGFCRQEIVVAWICEFGVEGVKIGMEVAIELWDDDIGWDRLIGIEDLVFLDYVVHMRTGVCECQRIKDVKFGHCGVLYTVHLLDNGLDLSWVVEQL